MHFTGKDGGDDAARMKMTPAVGNWRNNGPEMLQPPIDS
jgi:hypothetical protein